MIEMRLLEILAAFSEEGTQAAAAERLHISQPTLSGAMKVLFLPCRAILQNERNDGKAG